MPFILPFFTPLVAQDVTILPTPGFRQVVPVRPDGSSQAPPLMQLDQALPSLAWKVNERGPLMVVGANKIRVPDFQTRMQKQALPTIPPPNTSAKTIADLFEYRVEKVGTLHALVPTRVKKFEGAPNIAPEDMPPLERHELAQALGYSLTKEQWGILSSQNGLGLNDLNPKQQALFLQILPDPIRLRSMNPAPSGRQEPVELTPDQRAQVRIRMNRRLSVMFMPTTNINTSVGFGNGPGEKQPNFYMEYTSERKDPLYERVAPLVPNRPKPSDLDFNAAQLSVHIPFEGISTVEQLMERVRQVTGARVVLADARLGAQSVKFWGESAQAGDLLQALCRSFGGTFRKVGEGSAAFFVLTEDRIGLGTRLAAFGEWRSTISSLRWQRNDKQRKSMADLDIRSISTLDDPYGLSAEQRNAVDKSRYYYTNPSQERGLSVASLPPSLQAHVQQTLEKNPTFRFNDGTGEQEQPLRKDRVVIQANYQTQLMIPGWGETSSHSDFWNLTSVADEADNARYQRDNPYKRPVLEPKPLRYPAAWRVRALNIRPKDPAEARALAKLAKASGFTTLWLTVPADAAKARPLIEAAQAEKLPVVAVISVLQVPRSAVPPDAEPDISILGETSDQAAERQRQRNIAINPEYPFPAPADPPIYLAPTAATQKVVLDRAAAVAKIPGLAALVLRGVTPPGYGDPGRNYFSGQNALGFTLENRLAFLQKESIDPIDLTVQYMDSRLLSPFFESNGPNYIQLANGQFGPDPSWRDRQRLWSEFLYERINGFTKTLFTRLKEASPTLPLWIAPLEFSGSDNFLCLWEKPDAKLAKTGNSGNPSAQFALARSFSSTALTSIYPIWRDDKKKLLIEEWRGSMAERFKQLGANNTGAATWAGFYLDLSNLSAEEITEQLPYYKEAAP